MQEIFEIVKPFLVAIVTGCVSFLTYQLTPWIKMHMREISSARTCRIVREVVGYIEQTHSGRRTDKESLDDDTITKINKRKFDDALTLVYRQTGLDKNAENDDYLRVKIESEVGRLRSE